MSISSDGILVFGIDLGEAEQWAEWTDFMPRDLAEAFQGDCEFEEWLAREAGLEEYDHEGMSERAKNAYFARMREIVAACPVEDVLHCAYDYGMIILAVRGYEHRASRGSPVDLTPDMLAPPPAEKVEAFKQWLREHNVNLDGLDEPHWILTSIYG